MALLRTRWAAVGAAVAVTLGAGGIGLVSATEPTGAATLVSITPCRIIDTRPEFNVGPKTSPLGPGETHTVMAHGDNGDCTGIPADAVALLMNVTAVDASAPTFLTIWATGDPQPTASSLNPSPGQPPAPNAVTTSLSAGGSFDIFNLAGNVDVLADVSGYFVDHHHDDRYYTKDEVDDLSAGAGVEWMNVRSNGTIRSASPGLDGMSIVRPASQPAGHYCIVGSPLGVSFEAAVGSVQHGHGGDSPRTMLVTTTFGNGCNSVGLWFLAIETFAGPDKADASFIVMVPRQ